MPLYEYKCRSCGYIFEELMSSKSTPQTMACKKCGDVSERKMSVFSSVVSGGSPNETIDMTIGREAEKRWQHINDRQNKRRSGKNINTISLPKTKDGKYMPVMGLGSKTDREKRTEYVSALQDHRKKREEKGIPQFSGPGEF